MGEIPTSSQTVHATLGIQKHGQPMLVQGTLQHVRNSQRTRRVILFCHVLKTPSFEKMKHMY
jgi:hypothetical protein